MISSVPDDLLLFHHLYIHLIMNQKMTMNDLICLSSNFWSLKQQKVTVHSSLKLSVQYSEGSLSASLSRFLLMVTLPKIWVDVECQIIHSFPLIYYIMNIWWCRIANKWHLKRNIQLTKQNHCYIWHQTFTHRTPYIRYE